MATRHWIVGVLGLAACSPDPGAPYWALDPITLYPDGDGVYGLQTWELYGEDWGHRFAQKWYVCSVVVEFDGTAATPCEGCTQAWDVAPRLVESDCAEGTDADPHFLALSVVALSPDLPAVDGKDPHPGASSGALADYGDGWTDYGWAYPEALDQKQEPASDAWDGTEPFALWPAYAWQM